MSGEHAETSDIEKSAAPSASEVNPARKGIKKGLYLIPSAFTSANIIMGFYSLLSCLHAYRQIGDCRDGCAGAGRDLDLAAMAIGWAVLFDALDGRIARMTKTTTEIGLQLDSIADVVTFGVAPAFLAYVWGYGSAFNGAGDLYKLGSIASFVYLLCGAFRLARFNVQASRPHVLAAGVAKVDKKSFVGLPIPFAAGLIAATVHFMPRPIKSSAEWTWAFTVAEIVAVLGLGFLMVSTFRYTSFKEVGTQHGATRNFVLLAALAGLLIWFYSRYVLLAIVLLYVIHAPVLRVFGALRYRRRTIATEPSSK